MKWTTIIITTIAAFLTAIWVMVQWARLPDAEESLELGSTVHFTVRKRSASSPTVELTGNAEEYSVNVSLENISDHLKDAIVANEDRRFYERGSLYMIGKAVQAIFKCLSQRLTLRPPAGCAGNSTITQQLAKIMMVAEVRTPKRKIRELIWALKMESTLSKDAILQMYLNRIPLGSRIYGVEMAARRYFGKRASTLSLNEAALIAASVRRPRENWADDRSGAIRRANIVLDAMFRHGFIPQSKHISAGFQVSRGQTALNRPFFGHVWSWIKPDIEQALLTEPAGIYKVWSTINAEAQIYARNAISKGTHALRKKGTPASQGSIVLMRPSGQVLAMIGGADDSDTSRYINRTVPIEGIHCRPPASLMKLVVYTAALELGMSLSDEIDASPFEFTGPNGMVYRPTNHDGKTYKRLTLLNAYVHSVNTAAVRLLANTVHYDHWFSVAERYGLPVKKFRRELGLALGQPEVCMIHMMRPFGIVASGGFDTKPHGISRIINSSGDMLLKFRHKANLKFDRDVMANVRYLGAEVIKRGTGVLAGKGLVNTGIGGKTGTTDGFHDAWFIGYTRQLVAGVWIGNDIPTAMPNTYGGSSSALIFNELMTSLLRFTNIATDDTRLAQLR